MIMINTVGFSSHFTSYHDHIHFSMSASQLLSESDKALGRVGGELHIRSRHGVDKAELVGVQTLTVKLRNDLGRAVHIVARDGVSDACEVDANLVRSACLQTAEDIGEAAVALEHLDMGHGGLGIELCHAHLLAVDLVPSDGRVNGALVLLDVAVADGEVLAREAVRLDLLAESGVGDIGLRDRQQSAGVLVDTVDDPGAQLAVDARQLIAATVHQSVDQRAAVVARSRVHHHSLGLIDHEQVRVLIDDIEGDILRRDIHGLRVVDQDGDTVADGGLVVLLDRLLPYRHHAVVDQLCRGRSAQIVDMIGEVLVDTNALIRRFYGKIKPVHRASLSSYRSS